MTAVFTKRGEEIQRQTHTGGIPCDNGSRDWSEATTRQRTPRIAGNKQKLGERGDVWK